MTPLQYSYYLLRDESGVGTALAIAHWVWSFVQLVWQWADYVWGLIMKVWQRIKEVVITWLEAMTKFLDRMYKQYVQGWLIPTVKWVIKTYENWIKPTIEAIQKTLKWISDKIDWVYSKTIGLIEDVYNKLFGWMEDLWKKFEVFRDKTLRLIALVNEDLSKKIYETTEKLEAQTIGKVRDLRDELLKTIREYYHLVRDPLNKLMWRVNDIAKVMDHWAGKLQTWFKITPEGKEVVDGQVMEDTLEANPTRLYGIDVFPWEGPPEEQIRKWKEASYPPEWIDYYLEEMNKGSLGMWADVDAHVDLSVKALDEGRPPPSFAPDPDLLSQEEREEYMKELDRLFEAGIL